MDLISLKDLLQRLLPSRRRDDAPPMAPADWSVARAVNADTGAVGVLRIRTARPLRSDIDTLTTAIVIRWAYESENGMPPAGVNQQHLQFEAALDPLSPDEENSELVQVFTGMGSKEWTFYARSRDLFMTRLNQLLAGHPRYPLEIAFHDDPEWQIWADFWESMRGKGVS